MSCGQLALEKAGIPYNKYYSSEIDKHSIKVCQDNYPNTIQSGDVSSLRATHVDNIELLIGGSPCQGLSLCGKRLNFNDPRSKLFFEYLRLLKELKPSYFLLENVCMNKESEYIITQELGVSPILINSALVSAQNRKRLYWTNIPNVAVPSDQGIKLQHILDSGFADREKSFCLRSSGGLSAPSDQRRYFTHSFGQYKFKVPPQNLSLEEKLSSILPLSINELEKLQTVPVDYSKSVSYSQRYKMLGNGWTVDVIAHILKNIV